jgi:hypothetical protein
MQAKNYTKYRDLGASCDSENSLSVRRLSEQWKDDDTYNELSISSNNVDLHTAGTYAVTYQCIGGNLMKSLKVRTVIVKEYNCK